jgi:ubiquinone/menaquinone biosynthesis C-methylase UbiE
MSEITKTIADLQQKQVINVIGYRKSRRMGLDIPIYSMSAGRRKKLDVHGPLAGVTSERLVEYDFVSRHLVSSRRSATILDVGSAGSALVQVMREFGSRWRVLGIDLAQGSDAVMDTRSTGFRDRSFDQVISISTIEHIGVGEKNDDVKAMQEIFRILKEGGSAIITVPYGSETKPEHRVYDRRTLAKLAGLFTVAKKEFYRYDVGKWKKCSQSDAGRNSSQVPLHFHSSACACLLLKKKQ